MTCTPDCVRPTPSQAHCPTCHATFGGVRAFDRHRFKGQCRPPAVIGLVDNGHGVWRAPMGERAGWWRQGE